MDGEEIARLRLADPFRPFTLVTQDGRRLPVSKPYWLAINRNRTWVVYEAADGNQLVLKASGIASVELDGAAGLSSQGVPA